MRELLEWWNDPVFGELVWDETNFAWSGNIQFGGHIVRVSLDPDRIQPTLDEQRAVIELSRGLLDPLRQMEPDLKRQAAEQITEAVSEQDADVNLPLDEFLSSLELECISLHGCGELHYRCPRFFPGQRVTVYFDNNLSFGGAEVYA